MDREKTLENKIVQFERVAPGILIPVGQEKSWWRDKISNKLNKDMVGEGYPLADRR